jgi:hypothetical protein
MTEAVRQMAKELNIELMDILASCKDELQPFDRKVFGRLKAKAVVKSRWAHIIPQYQVELADDESHEYRDGGDDDGR